MKAVLFRAGMTTRAFLVPVQVFEMGARAATSLVRPNRLTADRAPKTEGTSISPGSISEPQRFADVNPPVAVKALCQLGHWFSPYDRLLIL